MRGRAIRVRAITLASALACAGCAGHNLVPVTHVFRPAVRAEPATTFTPAAYRTFSVFPLSWVTAANRLKYEAVEQQLLFAARAEFESLGYTFVRPESSPDFFVTVDASIALRLDRLPASATVAVPSDYLSQPQPAFIKPVPLDSIIETSSTMMEVVRWLDDAGHAFRAAHWGIWQDPRPRPPVTAVPEYPPRTEAVPQRALDETLARLGRRLISSEPGSRAQETVLAKYAVPLVWVMVVDGRTREEEWAAAAAGLARSSARRGGAPAIELAVSAQVPLGEAIRQFPPLSATSPVALVEETYGLRVRILTNDGLNFFPSVLDVGQGSPAWWGGLRPYDIILTLGGISVVNVPYAEFIARLAGTPAGPFAVAVWRKGAARQLTLNSPGRPTADLAAGQRRFPVPLPPASNLSRF